MFPEHQECIRLAVTWLTAHEMPGWRQVLDVGCGTGSYATALANAGFDVVGIDFAPGMLRKARPKARRAAGGSLSFERVDFNTGLPFPSGFFGAALCISSLQETWDPPGLIGEIGRILRPAGLLLLAASTPQRNGCSVASASDLVFWTLRKLPGWRTRVQMGTMDELIRWLNRARFEVVEERVFSYMVALLTRKQKEG